MSRIAIIVGMLAMLAGGLWLAAIDLPVPSLPAGSAWTSPGPPANPWLEQRRAERDALIARISAPGGLASVLRALAAEAKEPGLLAELPDPPSDALADGLDRLKAVEAGWYRPQQSLPFVVALQDGRALPFLLVSATSTAGENLSGFDATMLAAIDAVSPHASAADLALAMDWLARPRPFLRRIAGAALRHHPSAQAALAAALAIEQDAAVRAGLALAAASTGSSAALQELASAIPGGEASRWLGRGELLQGERRAGLHLLAANDPAAATACSIGILEQRGWRSDLDAEAVAVLAKLDAKEVSARLRALLAPSRDWWHPTRAACAARLLRRWDDPEGSAWLAEACRRRELGVVAGWVGGQPDAEAAAWVRPLLHDPDPTVRYQAMHAMLSLEPAARETILQTARTWREPGLVDEVLKASRP